jgi:hypothetical protein
VQSPRTQAVRSGDLRGLSSDNVGQEADLTGHTGPRSARRDGVEARAILLGNANHFGEEAVTGRR